MNNNRCVVCGQIIPEGTQVCPNCLSKKKSEEIYTLSPLAEELKSKLNEIRGKRRLVKTKLALINEERESYGIMAVGGGVVVGGGERTSLQERILIRIETLQEDADKLMNELFTLEDELSSALPLLPATEQGIIIDRYMNGWSWDKIMKKYGYERPHIFRLQNKALNTISKKLK